jgi:hypothetical protein
MHPAMCLGMLLGILLRNTKYPNRCAHFNSVIMQARFWGVREQLATKATSDALGEYTRCKVSLDMSLQRWIGGLLRRGHEKSLFRW